MRFVKPALTIDQQIAFLRAKNLIIEDGDSARRHLTNIGLFRLKPYRKLFYRNGEKTFRPDVHFEDVHSLYRFDRTLRNICMAALERIEVSIRTVISNVMSEQYGPHWFLQKKVFVPDYYLQRYGSLLKNIDFCSGKKDPERGNPASRSYYVEYSDPPHPPSWVIIEVMTMTSFSKIYMNIRKTKYKKRISGNYGFDKDDFGTWYHAMSLMRNICAHHDRFWNRKLKARATNVARYTHDGVPLQTSYTNLCILWGFLKTIDPDATWNQTLYQHISSFEDVDIHAHMGFPLHWLEIPFWGLS